MFKNKKILIVTMLFTVCFCITSMISKFIFSQNAVASLNIPITIEPRYNYPNIILTAGYENATCTVKDVNGNDISQDDAKKFFIEDENVQDSYGNCFVKLKKYYINMSQDTSGGNYDGVITYKLATTKIDDSYFVCPYFYDKDGNEIEYAYYGKYKGSVNASNRLCSKIGLTPTYNTNVDTFRTYARANGDEYHQTDWCAVFTAQIMCMCVYKTTNSDNIFSSLTAYETNTGEANEENIVLGIEDLIGNGFEFVDGVRFNSGTTFNQCSITWSDKISDYSADITTNETNLSGEDPTDINNCYIRKMNCVNGKPALCIFPSALTNGSSQTYYCDEFTFSSAYYDQDDEYIHLNITTSAMCWGASYSLDNYGLFNLVCGDSWRVTSGMVGSRLHAKALA